MCSQPPEGMERAKVCLAIPEAEEAGTVRVLCDEFVGEAESEHEMRHYANI